MTSLRDQERLTGDIRPIILNVCNFSKPAAGEPALCPSTMRARLFHEFGHALHGLLSNVTYPLLSGTALPSDFVELPSQLYEHWLEVPEILQTFARHAAPASRCRRHCSTGFWRRAHFGQGFATVEYTACAIVDLDLHSLPTRRTLDVAHSKQGARAHRHAGAKS